MSYQFKTQLSCKNSKDKSQNFEEDKVFTFSNIEDMADAFGYLLDKYHHCAENDDSTFKVDMKNITKTDKQK